jgi:hypothetical protein
MYPYLLGLVRNALKNSADNGYDHNAVSVQELAFDLQYYDAEIEHYDLDDIEECIIFLRSE